MRYNTPSEVSVSLVPLEPRPAEEPVILRLVDWLCRPEDRILARVAARQESLRLRGLEGVALHRAVARDLVVDHAAIAAFLNAAAAAPFGLPLVGSAGTTVASVLATVVADLTVQTELVIALAGAWESPLRGEPLRRATRQAIRMSGERDYRDAAWTVGLRVTVKKLAVKGLGQAIARAGWWRPLSPSGAANLAGWAAVPVVGAVAWRDMFAVAERARACLQVEAPPLSPP
jgi:hypothetical protein